MILRGLFWISVVAVLMPHEPDLGLGRPTTIGALARSAGAEAPAQAGQACGDNAKTCAVALGLLDSFQVVAVKNLAEVKADIEREERASARRGAQAD